MKVLIISDAWHPQVNGVVRTYEYLEQEMLRQGHDVKIIGPADFPLNMPMPFYQEIRLALWPYKRLARMMRDFAPDKIHIATEGPLGWAAQKYCKRHKQHFTTSYHTQFPDYAAKRVAQIIPALYNTIHRKGIDYVSRFHRNAKATFVATDSLRALLKGWGFDHDMPLLTRGVDLDLFTHDGEKTLFHDLTAPVALYVGRVAIEKNLEAFLDMPWDGAKVLVGDGPHLPYLKKTYPNAIFVGKKSKEDLAQYYKSADVFVFPSKTDTFGIVLIEAMACGLPVAAYPVTGPIDIVKAPYHGCLGDDLATCAQRALQDRDPAKLSHYIHTHYSWETATDQFIKGL